MKVPFLQQQAQLEKGHSRTTSQPGSFPFITDLKAKLLPLTQHSYSIPNPLARALKLVAAVLVFVVLCLNLPSRQPYATDLVLETADLRNGALVSVKPVRPSHAADDLAKSVNESTRDAPPTTTHVMNCNTDVGRLREIGAAHDLGDQIEYLKHYVRFTRKPIERRSYTMLQQSLLPDSGEVGQSFRTLRLSESNVHEAECRKPLDLEVPQSPFPANVDLSDYFFALTTTFKRLKHPKTIEEWAYWLTDGNGRTNGDKLLVRLTDASDVELRDVTQRLADVGIDAEISSTKQWFVLCDADTFFSAMNSLVAKFKQYDPTMPLYIGTLSEDAGAVKLHGSQAFGGGGVFLSRPLAKIISSVHDTCNTRVKLKESNSGWGPQGDILLRKCIYENTDVRLTQLDDLWQLDLSGDAAGFYEGGLKPFSIHHFKGHKKWWHASFPLNTTKIARTCGEDCSYQRFVTADNFIISNGYSIAQYPEGIDFDLNQIEGTFRSDIKVDGKKNGWGFDYTFGPQRPPLSNTGKKMAWDIYDSQYLEDGSVSQVYVRKKDDERWTTKDGKPMKALDGIIELIWIPA
ncbi:Venom serine carboxypeptidase [Verticillium dahliae VDG1]|nr:Venom serine carboxypeptidase [Verticillium dahliae VDG1]